VKCSGENFTIFFVFALAFFWFAVILLIKQGETHQPESAMKFSDLTQDDLDRMDASRSMRSLKAALTRKLEKERAKRDAWNDRERFLFLGEHVERDLWAPNITVTYRKTYRAETCRLYREAT
jgi:hypothetical protein